MEYEKKFADFIKMCEEGKKEQFGHVIIPTPVALGDNYEEVIESLNRLTEAGLMLAIAAPARR